MKILKTLLEFIENDTFRVTLYSKVRVTICNVFNIVHSNSVQHSNLRTFFLRKCLFWSTYKYSFHIHCIWMAPRITWIFEK